MMRLVSIYSTSDDSRIYLESLLDSYDDVSVTYRCKSEMIESELLYAKHNNIKLSIYNNIEVSDLLGNGYLVKDYMAIYEFSNLEEVIPYEKIS